MLAGCGPEYCLRQVWLNSCEGFSHSSSELSVLSIGLFGKDGLRAQV